jgi:hypothetical protein
VADEAAAAVHIQLVARAIEREAGRVRGIPVDRTRAHEGAGRGELLDPAVFDDRVQIASRVGIDPIGDDTAADARPVCKEAPIRRELVHVSAVALQARVVHPEIPRPIDSDPGERAKRTRDRRGCTGPIVRGDVGAFGAELQDGVRTTIPDIHIPGGGAPGVVHGDERRGRELARACAF